MSLINQKVISLLLDRFRSARLTIDLNNNEIKVEEKGQILLFFIDPEGGAGDQLLSILPLSVKTISSSLCGLINGETGYRPSAQLIEEDELHRLSTSLTHHEFILCEQTEARTNRTVFTVTTQIGAGTTSTAEKPVGVLLIDRKVKSPYAEASDYADYLTVFANGEFWSWENESERVDGYVDFEAAFNDASF